MVTVYFLITHLPAWSLPLAFVVFELGRYFRRRQKWYKTVTAYTFSFSLMAITAYYFYDQGWNHWAPAVKDFIENVRLF